MVGLLGRQARVQVFVLLCSLGVLQLLGCSASSDVSLSPELFVRGGDMQPRAMAAAKDREDVYIYAGEATYGESAVAVQLSANRTDATVLWRYDRDPKFARMNPYGVYFATGLRPAFNGVVSMADGSTFLCGNGPADRGSERPGLLAHLDQAGRVISEQELWSSNVDVPPEDRPLDPSNTGARSNTFDTCLAWDGYVGAVGRVLYYPRIGERRGYYWIVAVNPAGKVAWQKLIPQVAPILSETAELTSARITPHRNLLFTRHWGGTSEIVLVNPTGELVGSRRLAGYFVAVSSTADHEIQVVGGDPKGRARLLTLDEELKDIRVQDDLDLRDFVAVSAYRVSDTSLLLLGRDEGAHNFSSFRYVTKQGTIQKERLIHDDLFDEGTIKVSSATQLPDQFIIARSLLKGRSGKTENLGVALNVIQSAAN